MVNKILKDLAISAVTLTVLIIVSRNAVEAIAGKDSQIDYSKIDPVSENNIFYQYFTRTYQAITGSDQSLGADVYDWTHKPDVDPDAYLWEDYQPHREDGLH